jgi:adenine/guanine phosphoribosyltransferase-like PRPP-binding protein
MTLVTYTVWYKETSILGISFTEWIYAKGNHTNLKRRGLILVDTFTFQDSGSEERNLKRLQGYIQESWAVKDTIALSTLKTWSMIVGIAGSGIILGTFLYAFTKKA